MIDTDTDTETRELLQEAFEDFTIIDTRRRLRGALLYCARMLDRLGDKARADTWRERVTRMPATLPKEAINMVLLVAYWELEEAGIVGTKEI